MDDPRDPAEVEPAEPEPKNDPVEEPGPSEDVEELGVLVDIVTEEPEK